METKNEDFLFHGTVFDIIRDAYKSVFSKDVFIAPNIPEKKINGAIKSMANGMLSPNEVLLIYDATVFGSAAEGILLTKDAIYAKEFLSDAHSIPYADIISVTHERTVTKDKGGKEKISENVVIIGKNEEFELKIFSIKYDAFTVLLKSLMAANYVNPAQSDVLERRPLEDMPLQIKSDYLKVIINYFLSDDEKIDDQEFSQLYSLIARLKLNAEERFEVLDYQRNTRKTTDIIDGIISAMEDVAKQEIVYSLMKDLIYIHEQIKNTTYTESNFIMNLASYYNVSDEQLEFFEAAIENDKKIFDDNVDDSGLESGFKGIASNAAAVGVPLAAVYFSGSVIGLGATGITSGLATLGLGGVLGFSSMVTGLGAVLLIGFGAKKGIEYLTGQGEVDKRKRKEALLLEVNKHLQRSINMLMEDINLITDKIGIAFDKIGDLDKKMQQSDSTIKKLIERLQSLSAGSRILDKNRERAELYAWKQRIPRHLDVEKLRAITNEPTTMAYYDAVISCYDEDDDCFLLKENLTNDEAQALSQLLEKIEYFSASSVAKQGLNKISRMFKK